MIGSDLPKNETIVLPKSPADGPYLRQNLDRHVKEIAHSFVHVVWLMSNKSVRDALVGSVGTRPPVSFQIKQVSIVPARSLPFPVDERDLRLLEQPLELRRREIGVVRRPVPRRSTSRGP